MEANKENVRSKTTNNTFKTRIPVPVEPLPLLPKHLINKTNRARAPLKTIKFSNANVDFSSSQNTKKETKIIKKVILKSCATQIVTYSDITRDWAKNIFKDDVAEANENNCVDALNMNIPYDCSCLISDDDSEKEDTVLESKKNEQKSMLCVVKSKNIVVTPAAHIEHRGLRNIKKSLKRPHSRELLGLSPTINEKVEEKAKRCLIFDQLEDKLLSSDFYNEINSTCLTNDYLIDIFPYLRSVESKTLGVPNISSRTRACVINWLLKINGPHGNPAVIQSACWYLDSYLSKVQVPIDQLQVVASACYWIAHKLHGPILFLPTASKLVLYAFNAFTTDDLRAVEMKILHELGFPQQPVVPQDFITYVSSWCESSHPGEIKMAATFLCMAGIMMDKSLCEVYPSVIAAAAVKTAILLLGKFHLLDRLIVCPVYQTCVLKFSNTPVESVLRKAVRTISSPEIEYNALLQHYGHEPLYIAQKLVKAANLKESQKVSASNQQ